MPFTIPNLPSASFPDQAAPDKVDFDVIVAGSTGTGVVSGCAVTPQATPNMTVAVAAGVVSVAGVTATVTAASTGALGAADATNPRFDLITVNSAGVIAVTAGAAAATAVFPSVPASSVVIAAVYVPVGTTSIGASRIVDKRVDVRLSGAPTIGVANVNLGANAQTVQTATVAVPGLTNTQPVMVTWGAGPDTDTNDPSMDTIAFAAVAGTGQFTLTATSPTPIGGLVRVNYLIGA